MRHIGWWLIALCLTASIGCSQSEVKPTPAEPVAVDSEPEAPVSDDAPVAPSPETTVSNDEPAPTDVAEEPAKPQKRGVFGVLSNAILKGATDADPSGEGEEEVTRDPNDKSDEKADDDSPKETEAPKKADE